MVSSSVVIICLLQCI